MTERRGPNRLEDRLYHTFAAAARELSVSETTLRKWIAAGLVKVTMIGPEGHELKRIASDEIERLRKTA